MKVLDIFCYGPSMIQDLTLVFCGKVGIVTDIAASNTSNISVAVERGGDVFIWGRCQNQAITEPLRTTFRDPRLAIAFNGYNVMHRPLELPLKDECIENIEFLDSFRKAFDNSENSDLTIEVDGKLIYVHKCILKIRCQHYKSMFRKGWAENSESVVRIDGYSYIVYKSFLEYLYTAEVDLGIKDLVDLVALADSYCELALRNLCIRKIRGGLTVQNVPSILHSALHHRIEEVQKISYKFSENPINRAIADSIRTFITEMCKSGQIRGSEGEHES